MSLLPRLARSTTEPPARCHAQCGHTSAAQAPPGGLAAPRWKRLRSPWRFVLHVPFHLPGPGGCLLAPWSAVLLRAEVRRSCQGHSDAELLMTPSTSQPSLTPPPSGSSCAINTGHGVDSKCFTTSIEHGCGYTVCGWVGGVCVGEEGGMEVGRVERRG